MGRGDVKTKKGKIFRGSYGNSRPRKPVKSAETPAPEKAAKSKPKGKSTAKKKSSAKS